MRQSTKPRHTRHGSLDARRAVRLAAITRKGRGL